MRQWMVTPQGMCRQHLLGEHVEHHMFLGSIRRGTSINGYIAKNLLEPSSLRRRHDALVMEMLERGYRHNSPFTTEDIDRCLGKMSNEELKARIDRTAAFHDLISRCIECRSRFVYVIACGHQPTDAFAGDTVNTDKFNERPTAIKAGKEKS
jgi:hypothetical protein